MRAEPFSTDYLMIEEITGGDCQQHDQQTNRQEANRAAKKSRTNHVNDERRASKYAVHPHHDPIEKQNRSYEQYNCWHFLILHAKPERYGKRRQKRDGKADIFKYVHVHQYKRGENCYCYNCPRRLSIIHVV